MFPMGAARGCIGVVGWLRRTNTLKCDTRTYGPPLLIRDTHTNGPPLPLEIRAIRDQTIDQRSLRC